MDESRRFEPAYFICLSLARLAYHRKEDYIPAAKAIYDFFEVYREEHPRRSSSDLAGKGGNLNG